MFENDDEFGSVRHITVMYRVSHNKVYLLDKPISQPPDIPQRLCSTRKLCLEKELCMNFLVCLLYGI